MGSIYYHQLGGIENRRLDLSWADRGQFWDHNKLARDVFSIAKGPLQLALGITNTGASYLLIPGRLAKEIAQKCRLTPPHPDRSLKATDFESVSPIEFQDPDQLVKKLGSLASNKNKTRKNGMALMDTSKANRGYDAVAMDPDRRNDGLYRPLFEHGRVLYRLKNNILDENLVPVRRSQWVETFRMCSFIYNRWQPTSPTILDIGLAEGAPGQLDPPSSVRQIVIYRNTMLNGGKRDTFLYGTAEVTDDAGAARTVQEFFQKRDSGPMLLLVCGRKDTLEVLKQFYDVDTTAWGNGLKEILQPSSETTRSQCPVYVIDVKEMALKHFKVDEQQLKTVYLICTKLGLVAGGQIKTVSAGNDSRMIYDAWTVLAEGPAIDEKRQPREQALKVGTPSANNGGDDPDSDFDPNDIVQQATTSTHTGQSGDGYLYDEDSDYGDDSE